MPDISQIPAPRVPLVEIESRITTREWYRFFYNVWSLLYSGTPQGVFYDTTTQSTAAINTATPITFNNTTIANSVQLGTPASRVYVLRNTTCNIQFTARLDSITGTLATFYLWLRVNNLDVPYSASVISVPDTNSESVASWNFVYSFAPGDYFELVWATRTHNGIKLTPAAASAPIPAIPSVSLTVTSLIGV